MKKIVYLMRHSIPLKNYISLNNNDSLQIVNEKNPLSVEGERKAEYVSKLSEFDDVDVVICSNYVRAIATAKYIADKNKITLNIDEDFAERKHGIKSWDELPSNFEERQRRDSDFKVGDGESRKEVEARIYVGLMNVLRNIDGEKIVIVSHATAITFLFMKLLEYRNDCLYFKKNVILKNDFCWEAPDIFKLVFENEELLEIKHISYDYNI